MPCRFTAILTAIFIAIFAMPVKAADCISVPPPVTEVRLHENPVKFDVSQSIEGLSRQSVDTRAVFPKGMDSHIGGVMSGKIIMNHHIGFDVLQDKSGRDQCVTISRIKIDMIIAPTIFIANNYQNQSCWFREIFSHETKHIDVDRAILKKYGLQLKDVLNMLLSYSSDYAVPIPTPSRVEVVRNNMRQGLVNALEVMFNKMMQDRRQQQKNIDTVANSVAINRSCAAAS